MEIRENVLQKNEWPEKNSALKSPWVVGWLLMVAVILAANITMITFAYKTSPGLVVDDYYEKGKNYNASLEKIAAQKELGWDGALLLPESIVAGERSSYGLRVIDRVGSAVVADSVEIYLFRPSDVSADFSSRMDPRGDGNYLADLIFPLPGVWDVVVSINRGGDQFEITERIFVSKNRGL